MALAEHVRRCLPAAAQDRVRDLRDILDPVRRQVASRRRADAVRSRAVNASISPDGRVLAGVFAGMQMPLDGSWGGIAARLVGSYEQEIAHAIRELIGERPSRVIDIGAADGYYAVGLARALPDAEVFAFDIDREARRLCRAAARLNGCRNVRVLGRANPERLRRLLLPGALVLSDCEGYEADLLDPVSTPVLGSTRLIVELHEFAVPGVTALMVERFTKTHEVRLVDAVERDAAGYPMLGHLPPAAARAAVDEGRPVQPHPMQWAVMRPRKR